MSAFRSQLNLTIDAPPPGGGALPVGSRRTDDLKSWQLLCQNNTDLLEHFPISARYPLQKSFWWGVGALLAWGIYLQMQGWENLLTPSSRPAEVAYLAARVVSFIAVLTYLHWEIYRRSKEVRIDGYRLLISRGSLVKTYGTIPLLASQEAYVRQSPLDILFGLYQLHTYAPVDPSKSWGKLEGLPASSAFGLLHFLTERTNSLVSAPKGVDAGKNVAPTVSAPVEETYEELHHDLVWEELGEMPR